MITYLLMYYFIQPMLLFGGTKSSPYFKVINNKLVILEVSFPRNKERCKSHCQNQRIVRYIATVGSIFFSGKHVNCFAESRNLLDKNKLFTYKENIACFINYISLCYCHLV